MGNATCVRKHFCDNLHDFSAVDFHTGLEVFEITHNLYLLEFR